MVWTTNDKLTHAYVSQHSGGELKPISRLHFDAWCPECVKVVYHKHGGMTHAMRFADKNEKAENDTKSLFHRGALTPRPANSTGTRP